MKEKNVLDMLRGILDEIEKLPESEILPPKDAPVQQGEERLGIASSLVQRIHTVRMKFINKLEEKCEKSLLVVLRDNQIEEFYKLHRECRELDELRDILDIMFWSQIRKEFNMYDPGYGLAIRDNFVIVRSKIKTCVDTEISSLFKKVGEDLFFFNKQRN